MKKERKGLEKKKREEYVNFLFVLLGSVSIRFTNGLFELKVI